MICYDCWASIKLWHRLSVRCCDGKYFICIVCHFTFHINVRNLSTKKQRKISWKIKYMKMLAKLYPWKTEPLRKLTRKWTETVKVRIYLLKTGVKLCASLQIYVLSMAKVVIFLIPFSCSLKAPLGFNCFPIKHYVHRIC